MKPNNYFSYESPQLNVVEFLSEGLLCASPEGAIDFFTEEDLLW